MKDTIQEILSESVRLLLAEKTIQQIILFGSYAYGQPTEKSDLDLCLVVKEGFFEQRNYFQYLGECSMLINRLMYENGLEYDLVACTEKDMQDPPNKLIEDVKMKGKILYERRS